MARPLIEVEGVSRAFHVGESSVLALRHVDLRVDEGEMIAVMGASGSGKSTLMNILGCLDRPTTGRYRLSGIAVETLDDDALAELRNHVLGFVFQGFNLIPRTTAVENVTLPLLYAHVPPREAREQAIVALRRVGLGDRLEHQPNEMSGGQQQRVAIARALVTNPRVVLADEPTGNLDSRTTVEVMALFQDLNHLGMTLVIVTHEDDVARYCRRVLMLRDGRILSDHPAAHGSARDDLARMPAEEDA
ncbi:MAG: ABC transporter ATP-binding protein [Deltaproteobacteria bacterium]|nr:ABC transporter ATP-binding protein [Deltaproteobacteria bacterium]